MAEDEADKHNLQTTNNDEECSKMFLSDQYNSNFHSIAFTSNNCSIPVNVLEFIHSFGYDCHRHFNLCACDENVVAWAAGSYIAFLDIITRKTKFQRSSTGGSIGSITKNPDPEVNHIAVGEGGLQWAKPVIIIYEWPSMAVVAVLRNGTEHSYAHMSYSPDGKMLASIGGAPDYNLTIWDWQKPCIILRTAAYSNTVFNVRFSPYIPGQLTTSGASHIKFWKMAPTFTCLKLKGELGRFGKTEICDIIGILPMPDEKVISGCSWGNILVWEGGLVKMEVCRKGRRSCHEGPVTQILRSSDTGEVTTIGFDGHICSWYWDTVEQADLPENDPFVELNPVAEIFIPNAKLMAVSNRKNDEWFAQDASGIIWAVSLENEYGAGAAEEIGGTHIERVVKSHGGSVVGLAPLRDAPFIATLGSDGTLLIHLSPRGPLLSASTSLHPATCMLYLPHNIDPTGQTLVLGFIDGSIRLLSIKIELIKHSKKLEDNEDCIILLQSLKPHTASVNVMSANEKGNLLVTASLDSTIFIYQTSMESSHPNLNPLYYIKTPTVVNSLCWKPHYEQVLLMAGNNCYVMEAELPITHHIPAYEEVTSFQQEFVSLLTAQLMDYTLRYKPEEEEEGEDEQCFDEESDSSEHFEETSESEHSDIELINAQGTKNKAMIWAKYDPKDVKFIWTAQEECGCLLRVCLRPEASALDRFAPLDGAWDITVISHMFISNNDYCILGMSDGEVRIMKMSDSAEEISDNEFAKKMHQRQKLLRKKCKKKTLEPEMTPCLNFDDFLRLPMHDSITGAITLMDISPCGNYFFTAGNDGNIFSYKNNLIFTHIEELSSTTFDEEELTKVQVKDELLPKDAIELSHEETAKEREKNSLLLEAAEHKKNVQNQLDKLRKEFNELLEE